MKDVTINVNGKDIAWDLTKSGIFHAEMAGEKYEAETLKKLTDILRSASKKTPLNIPCVELTSRWRTDTLNIRKGIVLSRHSRNGNLIVKFDDGDTEQSKSYRGSLLTRGLLLTGDVDLERLHALFGAKKAAVEAYDKFIDDNSFDVDVPRE